MFTVSLSQWFLEDTPTGVGAVVVLVVIPAQEQALEYAAGSAQPVAYGGTLPCTVT